MKLDPNVYIKAVNSLPEDMFSCNSVYFACKDKCVADRHVAEYEAVYKPENCPYSAWLYDSDEYKNDDVRVLMLLLMAEIVEGGGL